MLTKIQFYKGTALAIRKDCVPTNLFFIASSNGTMKPIMYLRMFPILEWSFWSLSNDVFHRVDRRDASFGQRSRRISRPTRDHTHGRLRSLVWLHLHRLSRLRFLLFRGNLHNLYIRGRCAKGKTFM